MIQPTPSTSRRLLAVIVSRGQSRNPDKREMESSLVAAASELDAVQVFDLPHLYDLKLGSAILDQLRDLECDLIVASWLFPRAAHWLLDRVGVRGRSEPTSFDQADDDDDDKSSATDPGEPRVIDLFPRGERKIHCLDMRSASPEKLIAEIHRIAESVEAPEGSQVQAIRFEDPATRRWYPVIDFSRCTNCMECIDFCLFGVYGLDDAETILVEQPDNCRKGCPACSRVCPAGAIMFPQHKAPAIAGAEVEGDAGFKIDLSLLFGAPDKTSDAIAIAARERDEQLLLVGRDAVGLPQLRSQSSAQVETKDDLDRLIDDLDRCEL